ncbi:hypothetical protein D9M68_833380 [compost metagenome]
MVGILQQGLDPLPLPLGMLARLLQGLRALRHMGFQHLVFRRQQLPAPRQRAELPLRAGKQHIGQQHGAGQGDDDRPHQPAPGLVDLPVAIEQLAVFLADELLERDAQAVHCPLAGAGLDQHQRLADPVGIDQFDGSRHLGGLAGDFAGNGAHRRRLLAVVARCGSQ